MSKKRYKNTLKISQNHTGNKAVNLETYVKSTGGKVSELKTGKRRRQSEDTQQREANSGETNESQKIPKEEKEQQEELKHKTRHEKNILKQQVKHIFHLFHEVVVILYNTLLHNTLYIIRPDR